LIRKRGPKEKSNEVSKSLATKKKLFRRPANDRLFENQPRPLTRGEARTGCEVPKKKSAEASEEKRKVSLHKVGNESSLTLKEKRLGKPERTIFHQGENVKSS